MFHFISFSEGKSAVSRRFSSYFKQVIVSTAVSIDSASSSLLIMNTPPVHCEPILFIVNLITVGSWWWRLQVPHPMECMLNLQGREFLVISVFSSMVETRNMNITQNIPGSDHPYLVAAKACQMLSWWMKT